MTTWIWAPYSATSSRGRFPYCLGGAKNAHGLVRLGRIDFKYLAPHLTDLEFRRGADGNQPALADEPDPLAQLSFIHVMRCYQDGGAQAGHLIDQFPKFSPADRIDPGGWFVQEYHVRLVNDGAAQRQALFPAAG